MKFIFKLVFCNFSYVQAPENIRFCGPWLCRSFNFLLKNAASEWRMILTIPDITPYWCADQPYLSLPYEPSIWSLLKALVLVNLNFSMSDLSNYFDISVFQIHQNVISKQIINKNKNVFWT